MRWILAARAGSRDAFDRLAERHRPSLLRVCRRRLSSTEDAEDAAQETLIRALRALSCLRDPQRFRPWLSRIAANVCRDRLARAEPLVPLDAGGFGEPAAAHDDPLLGSAVHDAVASLPHDLQVVVALRHLEGFSFKDIAQRLGLPVTTIKGRLNRGRDLLREEMIRMGVVTESAAVGFAPGRVALLLAPGIPYGIGGEDARALGRLLKDAGFAPSEVRPERAAASINRSIPEILVMADDVPGVDAFAVVRDLRTEHRTRGVAIMLLLRPPSPEGLSREDQTYRAWQAGVDCLLSLPCSAEELVTFAQRIEQKSRAQQCLIIATDRAWRGDATDSLRYLRAAIELGGEAMADEARRNAAFRRLARNVELRELVGELRP
ncbi:MAG: sigma-70 family RNA polymerase sigma factor [Armatimonadetes bacterium]|nr:sigma-70 family RNA polymerase sigma factor [Armatimonadota bacterium]